MSFLNISAKKKHLICKLLSVIPDEIFLKISYRLKTGRTLDLKNPKTYSEKINWLKIYDHNNLYTKLVDKYEVREYVKEKIGEKYLFPLLGVWNKPNEIDFSSLPNRFVLKCTHDYGSVKIIQNKYEMNTENIICSLNESLGYNFFYTGREWAYKNVKPRIIAEKYMEDGNNRLVDYKFFCFNGKVEFMFIATGRGSDLRFDFFNRNFVHLNTTNGVKNADVVPSKPINYDEMIKIAEKLSAGIDNVRVDLYDIDGRIYFSELTLYHNGGMVAFEPYEMDVELGRKFVIKNLI